MIYIYTFTIHIHAYIYIHTYLPTFGLHIYGPKVRKHSSTMEQMGLLGVKECPMSVHLFSEIVGRSVMMCETEYETEFQTISENF